MHPYTRPPSWLQLLGWSPGLILLSMGIAASLLALLS
jgi:hypothetical protein